MKVLCTTILFLYLSSAAVFAQSTRFQQIGLFTYDRFDPSFASASLQPGRFAYTQVTDADVATSQSNGLFPCRLYNKDTSGRSLRPWRAEYSSYARPAGSLVSAPFAYTTVNHSTRCSGGALDPFRIASCIGSLGFDTPALNRVQNVVAHVMRHYSWHEAVRVNRDCVRSLSCSSLYEKSVVQRMALRPPEVVP